MPKFSYSPEISLGTIAEILVVVGAIVGSYTSITNRLTEHDVQIKEHAVSISKLQDDAQKDRDQVRSDIHELNEKVTRALVENAKPRPR